MTKVEAEVLTEAIDLVGMICFGKMSVDKEDTTALSSIELVKAQQVAQELFALFEKANNKKDLKMTIRKHGSGEVIQNEEKGSFQKEGTKNDWDQTDEQELADELSAQ
jgi:hypothetical protein